MAVIEGYSEHVMDALGERADPRPTTALRDAMDAPPHSRSAPERVLERLLGFDLKLRQYELGKGFCDAVVAEGGIEAPQPGLARARRAAHAERSWRARRLARRVAQPPPPDADHGPATASDAGVLNRA